MPEPTASVIQSASADSSAVIFNSFFCLTDCLYCFARTEYCFRSPKQRMLRDNRYRPLERKLLQGVGLQRLLRESARSLGRITIELLYWSSPTCSFYELGSACRSITGTIARDSRHANEGKAVPDVQL